ncbi:hypothetical protein SNEBB_007368 [Seison nebaliae]|nr:hypothetical protein SNEBB_007368 [Seison nebaliae]
MNTGKDSYGNKREGFGKTVEQRSLKYRCENEEQNDKMKYGNLMFDPRVLRGNTYALHTAQTPGTSLPNAIRNLNQKNSRGKKMATAPGKNSGVMRGAVTVAGRQDVNLQTELYLEELTDRVEEADAGCQTDAFLERPPTPLFIPAKSGIDVETQIYAGELFDFDLEVTPLLSVLVGKTIEQALLEASEEEELAALRQQQREFEELRNAEMVEKQRLEEQEQRRLAERERRLSQTRDEALEESNAARKIAASAFTRSYLQDLVPSCFANLRDNGFFYDPVQRDLETGFMNWLGEKATEELQTDQVSQLLLDELIRQCVKSREETPNS